MRKVALASAALVAGSIAGTLGLQVALAAPPTGDTLIACERPGVDLRSPAANGTCPSGYAKKEITEPTTDVIRRQGAFENFTQTGIAANVVTIPDPLAGTYVVTASGGVDSTLSGAPVDLRCSIRDDDHVYSTRVVTAPAGTTSGGSQSITDVVVLAPGEDISVSCLVEKATTITDVRTSWVLVATPVSSVTQLPDQI